MAKVLSIVFLWAFHLQNLYWCHNLPAEDLVADSPYQHHESRGIVTPTWGQPWPAPQMMKSEERFMSVQPKTFRFELDNQTKCEMIDLAFERYYAIIAKALPRPGRTAGRKTRSILHKVKVYVDFPCEQLPHEKMDESYELKIDSPDLPGEGIIVAVTNWGALRALETFSQLLYSDGDPETFVIKSTIINDFPRFPYRSVLLDTARHYFPKELIFQLLDLMSMNKFNVFHWHVVDDHSFPYQSVSFPDLSKKGAYDPLTHVYTQAIVQEVIEYARLRGIRVIPEFDTPGHVESWGKGQPGLLTDCYAGGNPDGTFGPIDPTRGENYEFLRILFLEISRVFPDTYIHLGGDEVDKKCWQSNPKIQEFVKEMGFTNYKQVQKYYSQKLAGIVETFSDVNTFLVWQEIFDDGAATNTNNTVIHVWKNWEDWNTELGKVTRAGYRAIFSACWYLDWISYGLDWHKYYECDPRGFEGSEEEKNLVLGGGPVIWSEHVDETNLIPRFWPRSSAPAERLWSHESVNSVRLAAPRMEEHRCRLLKRGYPVAPINGPGFCPSFFHD